MIKKDIYSVLTKIYTDKYFRRLIFLNKLDLKKEFGLSDEESQVIQTLSPEKIEGFGNSIVYKLLMIIENEISDLSQIHSNLFAELEYFMTIQSRAPQTSLISYTLSFLEYLYQIIPDTEKKEFLDFEINALSCKIASSSVPFWEAKMPPKFKKNLFLKQHPLLRVGLYSSNNRYLKKRFSTLSSSSNKDVHILFFSSSKNTICSISSYLVALISMCDGTYTYSDLVKQINEGLGSYSRETKKAFDWLLQNGYILYAENAK